MKCSQDSLQATPKLPNVRVIKKQEPPATGNASSLIITSSCSKLSVQREIRYSLAQMYSKMSVISHSAATTFGIAISDKVMTEAAISFHLALTVLREGSNEGTVTSEGNCKRFHFCLPTSQ